MKFKYIHNNINVFDLEEALHFTGKTWDCMKPEERQGKREGLPWYSWKTKIPATGLS